jgi:hypothetical protein
MSAHRRDFLKQLFAAGAVPGLNPALLEARCDT